MNDETIESEELLLFYEDMDEQLAIMENTLMDMMDIPLVEINKDMINNLFRAMHTMKGNSSMFGFEKLVSFAHVAENLLDEIRNDQIHFNKEMLDVFLLVKDHAKTLISYSNSNEEFDEYQNDYQKNLLLQLNSFLDLKEYEEEKSTEKENILLKYNISISIKDSFFKSDMDIFSIIKYLDVIGFVSSLNILKDNIPLIDKLKALNSYTIINLEYETSETPEEIEASFEFVLNDIILSIVPLNATLKIQDNETLSISPSIDNLISKTLNNKVLKKTNKKVNKSISLRVDSSKVDQIINLISEMVIANAKVSQLANDDDKTELIEASDVLTYMLEEIRESVMDIRMLPVSSSFSKFRRIVNETAKSLGKDIEFVISGGDTELDKTVIEKISDPLIHMLRNSIDHGIESIKERTALGKNPKGKIDLRAYPDAGSIVIEVQDDGAGIDKDAILQKAIKLGIVSQSDNLNESEIFNLVFEAGLSSAKEVSNVSGRGVGMDVVRKNIEELKGSVEIESKLGKGSKIIVRLPLTLAIIDGFLVEVGDTKIIIPLDMIQECIELTAAHREKMKNNDFINLRGSILPLLNAKKYFKSTYNQNERENIIIIKSGKQKAGLIVNELHGEFQTVIKSLGNVFKQLTWISGGTILGNGEVALILDVPVLLKSIKQNQIIRK